MPILIAVFVLVWDFSAGAIQKGRASIAARELAFRHLIAASGRHMRDEDRIVGELTPDVQKDVKRPGWVNYKFIAVSNKEGFFQSQENANPIRAEDGGSGYGLFVDAANTLLGGLAGQRNFEVTLSAKLPFQSILPKTNAVGRLSIDSSPWTKKQLPCGYFTAVAELFSLPEKMQSFIGC